jgi:Xaa-Pro aminopeptidase
MSEQPLAATAMAAPMDIEGRAERVRAILANFDEGAGVDALLVTDLLNIRYLTGFTGGAGLLAMTSDSTTLVTDGRYGDQAAADLAAAGVDATIEVTRDRQREAIVGALEPTRRIGLEADSITWTQQRTYATEWFAARDVVATAGLIERLRWVKDEGELARIRAAAAMADAALGELKSTLLEGPTELEFQELLDARMRALGSSEPAFPTIVASGANAALPHHRPTSRVVANGDVVLVDFGGTVDGYRSDLSRSFIVGDAAPEATTIFQLVLEAQAAALAAVGDGVQGSDVDGVARALIEQAGRGSQFIHSTGHGVGLHIHEDPFISAGSTHVLATGHTVTVEPGIYVPGIGGIRIEDLVTVTPTGCEVLTRLTKSADPTAPTDGATHTRGAP